MRGNDYYELLGVSRDATSAEIRAAYRALAKVMHPDTGGTAGTFRLLREAYETLTDPRLRLEYDTGEDSDTGNYGDTGDYGDTGNYSDTGADGEPEPPHRPDPPVVDERTVPWWAEVRRPGRMRVVAPAVAGGWALVLALLLVTGVPMPVVACWLLPLVAAVAVPAWRWRAQRRAGAAFAAEFGARTEFGRRPGDDPEETAERLTADLISRYLTRIPAVRICHGLAAGPGSVFADIDHAVLCGRRLVLISSKRWLPGHYAIDPNEDGTDAVVWRDGHLFRGGSTDLATHVARYRLLFPGAEVRGVLLLYPSRPGAITTEDGTGPVTPADPDRFVRDIGGWLAEFPSTVDLPLLGDLVRLVVARD